MHSSVIPDSVRPGIDRKITNTCLTVCERLAGRADCHYSTASNNSARGFHGGGFHGGGFHDRGFHDRREFRSFGLGFGGFLGGYYPGYYGYRACYLTVYGTTACY